MQPIPSNPMPHDMPRPTASLESMRSAEFRPRRSIWPGVLIALALVAGVTALVVSQAYDHRSLGTRLDDTVTAAGSTVNSGVDGLRNTATGAAQQTAEAADKVAGAVGDAAITAAVKTALAADPSLSAVNIDVTTRQGSVLLEGPAPDEKSRHRAEVLAAAPTGVAHVDNRLVVPGALAAPAVKRSATPIAAKPAPAPSMAAIPSAAPAVPAAPAPSVVEAPAPVDVPPAPATPPAAS